LQIDADPDELAICNLSGLDRFRCEALHPGVGKAAAVTTTLKDNSMSLHVPLKRGCAMVLLRNYKEGMKE